MTYFAGCYHGNPPWPGDPTAPAPIHDRHRFCADLVSNPDAGHYTDAGTFVAPAKIVEVPCK